MKKIISLLLCAVMAAFALTSCVMQGGEQSVASTEQNESSVAVSEDGSSSEPTEIIKIPASAENAGLSGLYTFGSGLRSSSSMVSVEANGDCIRFLYITPGLDTMSATVVNYSASDDTVIGSFELADGDWRIGNAADGGFYACDMIAGKMSVYDSSCRKLAEYPVTGSLAVADPGINYIVSADEGSLNIQNVKSGRSDSIKLESAAVSYVGYRDGRFYFNLVNGGLVAADPASLSVSTVFPDNSKHIYLPFGIETYKDKCVYYSVDDPENGRMFTMRQADEYPYAASDRYIALYLYGADGDSLRVYDIKECRYSPELKLSGSLQGASFAENGTMTAVAVTNDENVLYYIYDLTESGGWSDIAFETADLDKLYDGITPVWTGSDETVALAQKVLEDYGVRVLFGDCGIDLSGIGYSMTPTSEEEAVSKIKATAEFFALFPSGFMNEVGNGREVWIYLCDTLVDSQTGSKAGIQTTLYGHLFMAVTTGVYDIYYQETLAHETAHVLDARADVKAIDGWLSLMPESVLEDGYTYSYTKGITNKYLAWDDGGSEVWFYEAYAKTFPEEDRAVTFQKMFYCMKQGSLDEYFANNENLRTKARYYCVLLRKSYESLAAADTLPWEELFGKIDINEFD